MNNRPLLFFVLAALLFAAALPASTVFAAKKTATLLEFKHILAKGWTAVFAITGNWTNADLKGNTVTVDGKTYNLYCNFRDENHISCTMHHDMGQKIGKSARFNIAGLGAYNTYITGVVPKKQICNSWKANWQLYEGLDAYGLGSYEGDPYLFYLWLYYAEWGTVTYGNNTPLEPPFYYYDSESGTYQEDGYDIDVYIQYFEGFEYYNKTCSEAEYGYDEALYESTGGGYDLGIIECIDGLCNIDSYYEYCEEGDYYYGYCDEDGCYDFVEEDGCSGDPE